MMKDQISTAQNRATTSTAHGVKGRAQVVSGGSENSIENAMTLLNKAMSELSSDPVRCVLAETAVALPVRNDVHRKPGRAPATQAKNKPVTTKASKGGRGKATASKPPTPAQNLSQAELHIIEAQQLLKGLEKDQNRLCSTDSLHVASKLKTRLGLLSSTMNVPSPSSTSELVVNCLASKDIAQQREQWTIAAERLTQSKAQLMAWPDITPLIEETFIQSSVDYNMDDLSDMPETWSIITISLADNQQELLMSKITGKETPFLLRIPLARSDMEIDEEDQFSYTDAKTELLDIITQANESAHDSRGQGDKQARKAWYAQRENLDKRLEAWLQNIENIWLGGFRGLLHPGKLDEALLAKFGQSLNRILDKHLPSRRKNVKNKTVLHPHVLEMFVGLGHPEETELEDAVTDLLYFVVDILQFSGEHNAYDEIDFDAILVDVLDALRSSHQSESESTTGYHMILVVDKELASFPWESLPCLQQQSVTRMPSLSSIIQRLKTIRLHSPSAQGHSIPADSGAYILNPSGDLASTQETFQPILASQLPGYSAMINAVPTEAEFSSMLTSNSLLLYFGHGSGAQYIRGRTIRNLNACAVTLLLGCSSAKMTECDKFESYGMPGYYIGGDGGCMAVVGTLWDVTDRDIDRFSAQLMVEWGLIDMDERVKKLLEKSKSIDKTIGHKERRGRVGLDEAVSKARGACLLKYLNGAAPVVYGIPVFLK